MTVTREDILDALSRVVTRGVKMMALADDLGLKKPDYARLRTLLDELTAEGVVQTLSGGAYAVAPHGRRADAKARPAALPWGGPDAATAAPAPAVPATSRRKTLPPTPVAQFSAEAAQAAATPTVPTTSRRKTLP